MKFENGPYIGPNYFTRAEHDLFFGREREIAELASLVSAYTEVLVYAQSAAGKSSLLHAGVIPALERKGYEVFYPPARVGGDDTARVPNSGGNVFIANALAGWTEKNGEPLNHISLKEFLRQHKYLNDGLRVIVFDQFEEIFAQFSERGQDREDFFYQVRDALDDNPRLRCIFVMRQEAIAELDRYAPILPGNLRVRFHLERLRKDATCRAVTGPLAHWHAIYEKGPDGFADDLADRVVAGLLGDEALGEEFDERFTEPLDLQIYCQNVWNKWLKAPVEDDKIHEQHLKEDGLSIKDSIKVARDRFFDEQVKKVSQETGVSERKLNQWFAKNLITDAGGRGMVHRNDQKGTTAELANTVTDVLEEHRLISSERRNNATWYELVHDRFIDHVQNLREQEESQIQREKQEEKLREQERLREEKKKKNRQTIIRNIAVIGVVAALLASIALSIYISPIAAPFFFARGTYHATQAALSIEDAEIYSHNQQAINAFNDTIRRRENWPEAHYNLALIYWEEEQYNMAQSSASKAILWGADYVDAQVLLANVSMVQESYVAAEKQFTKAIENDPECVAAYVGLAHALHLQEENDHAYEILAQALRLEPTHADIYRILGDIYMSELDTSSADACYQEYVQLAGDDADPLLISKMTDDQNRTEGAPPLSENEGCPVPEAIHSN